MADAEDLAAYLEEVRRFRVPDAALAARLLRRARSGDDDARRQLIEGLVGLAAEQAAAAAPVGMRVIDVVQEANVVLVQLVDDPAVDDPRAALPDALRGHLTRLRRREN